MSLLRRFVYIRTWHELLLAFLKNFLMRTPLSPLRNPTISTGKSPLTREEREIVNPFLSCSTLQLSPLSNASERRISIFAESTIEGIPPPPLSPCSINNTEEYNCCEDEDFLTMESIFLKQTETIIMLEKYLNHFVSVLAPFMTSASSACHAGGDNTGVLWQEYEMDLMRQLSRTCHELKFIWLKKRLCRKVEFIKLQRKLDKFKKNSVVKSPLLDGRRSSSLVPFNCVPFGARSDSASAHSRSSSSSSSSLAKKGTKLTKLEREVFEAKLIFHHCHVDVANDLEHLLKVVLPLTVVLLKRHFFLLLQFTLRKKDLSQKKGWLQNYSESSVNARTLLQPLDSLELLRA